ncbi:response regulator [Rhodoplanes sp. Z2-YC6860]|uniref:response regulator n=1 Tax=Rhodoplanes sp. Z2-YC6860 TaxID=674703 RepID=UPI00078E4826|nr:response regulator [Rhodoplanes sp. Z2-YC6860]AMN44070.1 sensor histidine kinase/response regulator [Rhodoplanes sp. Z2-YC6860]
MTDDIASRTLILAPQGRDAMVAKGLLRDAGLRSDVCIDLAEFLQELRRGADTAIVTEEAVRFADIRPLAAWVSDQPAWSDFPFVVLTGHGGGIERNPDAAKLMQTFGNVTFLERPFHPTTLLSVVQSGLRSRVKQHECRRLNEELEARVRDRTAELAAANHQLRSQIEEREKVESTLRQMQRLEAVGQLTSGVAHDFNNLLTVVLGNISFLEKGLAAMGIDGKIKQRLANMRMAAERGAKLTDQLLSFSRRQRLEPRSLDVNAAVTEMRGLLQSTLGGSIQIETQLEKDTLSALTDPTQLELAVLNLAINARDAMEGIGTLTIRTGNAKLGPPLRPEEPAAGEYVMVSVSDTGTGMTEEVRAKAFEPFFTTKDPGKGSGLGLSQILGFAKQSGGGIRLESRLNEGTNIRIYLPRAQDKVDLPKESSATILSGYFGGSTILLVDDDDAVREVTASMLRDMGYVVVEAGSGGAALEVVQSGIQLELVLLDFAMPGMNGAELARQIQIKRPTLPFLFITGFVDQSELSGVSEAFIVRKPFVDDELGTKIRTLLGKPDADKIVRLREKA